MADVNVDVASTRWIALAAVLCVALLSGMLTAGCYLAYYAPSKNGLCQGSVPGVQSWVWVKCADNPPHVPQKDR